MERSLVGQWELLSHVLPYDDSPIQKLRSMSRKGAQPWKIPE